MAEWLNTTFSLIDGSAFTLFNSIAKGAGGFLTPFSLVLSFLGKGGWAFIVLAVILLLFKNTRKAGLTALIAIAIGAIITNLTLKPLVGRLRPYVENESYKEMWSFVGAHIESERSFPSGHSTVSMASMLAIFLCLNKKKSWWTLIIPIIMAISRVYLIVHYLTDVLGGLMVGAIAAVCAYYIVKAIYSLIISNSQNKFCYFVLEWDIRSIIK